MKQIRECLDRFFDGKSALKRKWQARNLEEGGKEFLYLFHYHHLVLVYDLTNKEVKYQWYEVPTDKRGLDAALQYLREKSIKENLSE